MSPYRARKYLVEAGFGPRAFVPEAPPPFYFADFIRLLDTSRKLITRVTLGTILFVLAVALLLPTTYASSSVVMTPLANDPAAVQNQIQIITSHDLAAMVVDQLKLADDPEFNPRLDQASLSGLLREMVPLLNPRNWFEALSPASIALNREEVIETLQRHTAAGAEGLSTSITITATSYDPAKAALIANTIADVYVKSQVADKINVNNATTGWLNKKLSDLSQQLQLQQAAVQRYKAEHNLNDSAPSIVDQQMVGINAQIVSARSGLAEKQAINERINQLVASGNPADVAQIVASPLIVQLRAQQATLLTQEGELNSKYGPLHPKMQAMQEQRSDLDFKISQEVSRLAASAANDVMVARAHLNSLESSLGGTETTARSQNMARVQLQALESNANSTRTMYEAFVQRQSQNLDGTPESRIISSAPMPLRPAGPKRLLMVGASVPLGLILGVLAALVAEKLAPPVKVPRATLVPPHRRANTAPMTMWNGPPVLGEINDRAALAAADYVLDYPASKYAKTIAHLVRELEAKSGDGAIIALTSAEDGESRSAIAVSLARAAARMGKKTVILDCASLPLSSKAMKVAAKTGLYEVLSGSAILSQALAKDPRSKAYLLAAPKWPGNAATMFASRAMARLISVLRGGADFVVIDCGPLGAEAATVTRLADATVLVSKRGMLHSPRMAQAARALEQVRSAPVGIVITR